MATCEVMELIRERDEARLAAVDVDGIPVWWGC